MEKTKFDEEFQRLTTEMVEVAFEYIGRISEEVDNIYMLRWKMKCISTMFFTK